MKKNNTGLYIGVAVMVVAILILGTASISYAGGRFDFFRENTGGYEMKVSNEIILALEDIDEIQMKYSSPDIKLYEAQGDKLIVREYLKTEDVDTFAEVSTHNGTLTIKEGRKYPTFNMLLGIWRSEHIEIYIPKGYEGSLSVSSASGNIESEEEWRFHDFKAVCSSGEISLAGITAENIGITTSSGSIALEKARGNQNISSSSGNIFVQMAAGSQKITSSSGEISVQNIKPAGDIRITSSSGGVTLKLPQASSFQAEITTSSGGIYTDIDNVLRYNTRKNHAEGSYGTDTQSNVKITTSSGEVKVRLE